jgi:hypothetical protein
MTAHGLQGRFAVVDKMFKIGFDVRVMLYGTQGGHIQGGTDVSVVRFG